MTTDTVQDTNTEAEVLDTNADTNDQSAGNEQDSQPTGFDSLPKATQDEIKALRRENAKHRKALKDHEDAQKTEIELTQSQADEYKSKYEALEAKYRDTTAEAAFVKAAKDEKARTPRTLFRAYKSDLQFDDDGNVTNIADVIEKARTDEPDAFMASTGSADGGKTGTVAVSSTDKMNQALRDMAQNAPR